MFVERQRRGMTRVEVIALIGVIGMLTAFFLPELQSAREAARRNHCMGKAQKLGVALQNYRDVHRAFPATSNQGNEGGVASVWWPEPGSGAAAGAIPSAGYTTHAGSTSATAGYSWIVMILPYMDEGSLYDSISEASEKFSADAFTPYNVAGIRDGITSEKIFSVTMTRASKIVKKHFAAVQLDELICPSFSGTPTVAPSQYTGMPPGNPPAAYGYPSGSANLGSPPQLATVTNYVALSATHFPCMQYGPEPNVAATTDIPEGQDAPNGMIVPGTGLDMGACTDGTSRTMMLCETIEPAMNCWYDGTTAWTTGINPNTMSTFRPIRPWTPEPIRRDSGWCPPVE